MPGLYKLNTNHPRRVGLRAIDYDMESLHAQTKPKLPDVDINAPPLSSSDEDEETGGNDLGIMSEDNLLTAGNGERKEGATSVPDFHNEPSNIPHGTYTVKRRSSGRNSSQGSQKRKNTEKSESEENVWDMGDAQTKSSQRKKAKLGPSLNIHKGLVKPRTYQSKNASVKKDRVPGQFIKPDLEHVLNSVERYEEASEKPRFRMHPACSGSSSSQKTSQHFSNTSPGSSQESAATAFKKPRYVSHERGLDRITEALAPGIHKGSPDQPGKICRPTRSSESAQNPLGSSNPRVLENVQSAASIAGEKLGMTDAQLKLPQSCHPKSSPRPKLSKEDTSDNQFSCVLDDPFQDFEQENEHCANESISEDRRREQPALCPLCKGAVDRSFLEERMKPNERLTIREQTRFCKAHKRRAAENEWQARGYPAIDWPNLGARINQYHLALNEILQGTRASFYRNVFEDLIRSGKNWTWQKDLMKGNIAEELSPGYYGSRGAKLMMENIMAKFAIKIRRLATSDKLMSSGGVSGFVQAVLVPELAVMLIQADMIVDGEEDARHILRNSVDIGHMLNEEEDEEIDDTDQNDLPVMQVV